MAQSASTPSTPQSSVVMMPESDTRTLCVQLVGTVTKGDYDANFYKPLQKFVDAETPFGLLIDYTHYKGWHEDAAARSFESIIDHGKFARRMAYVAAPDSKVTQIKVAKPLLGGEVKFFKADELAKAVQWVKSD